MGNAQAAERLVEMGIDDSHHISLIRVVCNERMTGGARPMPASGTKNYIVCVYSAAG